MKIESMSGVPVFKFALRQDITEEKQFLPKKGEPDATGYDCRACPTDRKDIEVSPGQMVRIPLGFRTFCPKGWWYTLHPRSSFFIKKNMHALTGIIDETFPLETCLIAQYLPDTKGVTQNLIIKYGDPIAQIIPVRREDMEVVEISNKEIEASYKDRGAVRTGGFGSTDKKTEFYDNRIDKAIGFYKTGNV
jgi:dUTPase